MAQSVAYLVLSRDQSRTALAGRVLLTVERSRERATLIRVGAYGMVIGLLGAYVGYQAMPFGEVRIDGLSATYAISLGIASFITLIFVQRQITDDATGYEPLFIHCGVPHRN